MAAHTAEEGAAVDPGVRRPRPERGHGVERRPSRPRGLEDDAVVAAVELEVERVGPPVPLVDRHVLESDARDPRRRQRGASAEEEK